LFFCLGVCCIIVLLYYCTIVYIRPIIMLLAPSIVVVAASSTILLAVASQCARNMIQTLDVQRRAAAILSSTMGDDASCAAAMMTNPLAASLSESGSSEETTTTADRLQTMKRKELLEVFANSRAPTRSELSEWFACKGSENDEYCEWDAMLLNNNSFIMNTSSSFLTHALLGGIALPWRLVGKSSKAKGRWNGKAFGTSGKGINRFLGKDAENNPSSFRRHAFDYDIVQSKVLPEGDGGNDKSSTLALRLDYSRYQSLPISLWASMRDELRVVEASMDEDDIVLIGMGWMGWSGGPLNCSPFMLKHGPFR